MAFSFLRFSPGGGSDPKLRTDENASNEHTGLVKIDLGAEGANSVATGTLPVRTPGAGTIAHNQVDVTSAAPVQIAAARATRRSVTIINLGLDDVYIGDAAVQVTTGALLPGVIGAGLTVNTTAAVYGRTNSGITRRVSYLEEFD